MHPLNLFVEQHQSIWKEEEEKENGESKHQQRENDQKAKIILDFVVVLSDTPSLPQDINPELCSWVQSTTFDRWLIIFDASTAGHDEHVKDFFKVAVEAMKELKNSQSESFLDGLSTLQTKLQAANIVLTEAQTALAAQEAAAQEAAAQVAAQTAVKAQAELIVESAMVDTNEENKPSILPPPAPEKLPGDWQKAETDDGKIYYCSISQNKSQWDRPQPFQPLPPPPPTERLETDLQTTTPVNSTADSEGSKESIGLAEDNGVSVDDSFVHVSSTVSEASVEEAQVEIQEEEEGGGGGGGGGGGEGEEEEEAVSQGSTMPLQTLCNILGIDESVSEELIQGVLDDDTEECFLEWIYDSGFKEDIEEDISHERLRNTLLQLKNAMEDDEKFSTAFQNVCNQLRPMTKADAIKWIKDFDVEQISNESNDKLSTDVQRVVDALEENSLFARFWCRFKDFQQEHENVSEVLTMYNLLVREPQRTLKSNETWNLLVEELPEYFFSITEAGKEMKKPKNTMRKEWIRCQGKPKQWRKIRKKILKEPSDAVQVENRSEGGGEEKKEK